LGYLPTTLAVGNSRAVNSGRKVIVLSSSYYPMLADTTMPFYSRTKIYEGIAGNFSRISAEMMQENVVDSSQLSIPNGKIIGLVSQQVGGIVILTCKAMY
jgi:hypothetical protein